jgi:hypothetical protein
VGGSNRQDQDKEIILYTNCQLDLTAFRIERVLVTIGFYLHVGDCSVVRVCFSKRSTSFYLYLFKGSIRCTRA